MRVCLCAGGDEAALEYVKAVFNNVVVQPRDAREASDVFYKQKVKCVCMPAKPLMFCLIGASRPEAGICSKMQLIGQFQ